MSHNIVVINILKRNCLMSHNIVDPKSEVQDILDQLKMMQNKVALFIKELKSEIEYATCTTCISDSSSYPVLNIEFPNNKLSVRIQSNDVRHSLKIANLLSQATNLAIKMKDYAKVIEENIVWAENPIEDQSTIDLRKIGKTISIEIKDNGVVNKTLCHESKFELQFLETITQKYYTILDSQNVLGDLNIQIKDHKIVVNDPILI